MARPIDLALHIQRLVEEKQEHADALTRINQTLEGIGALLSQNGHQSTRKLGRPPSVASLTTDVAQVPKKGRRRSRRRFAVSGNDLILSFVKQRKNPTTRDLAELWKSESRGGKVDNSLSKLVKDRHLKRTPLGGGQKGSRYSLA